MRTEFPNLAIVSVVLKNWIQSHPWTEEIRWTSSEDVLEQIWNAASDCGEDEIVAMLDYIRDRNLASTFFPMEEK